MVFPKCSDKKNGGHDGCVQKGGKGFGLQTAQTRVHVETSWQVFFFFFFLSSFRTSSLACLLFTAEVNTIPPEQTVQLREKNSHLVPLSLWQCLDYKSGDSI